MARREAPFRRGKQGAYPLNQGAQYNAIFAHGLGAPTPDLRSFGDAQPHPVWIFKILKCQTVDDTENRTPLWGFRFRFLSHPDRKSSHRHRSFVRYYGDSDFGSFRTQTENLRTDATYAIGSH